MRTILILALLGAAAGAMPADPADLAEAWEEGVLQANREHLRDPSKGREPFPRERAGKGAARALEALLAAEDGPGVADALLRCGEAALDLDDLDAFGRVRERLLAIAPDHAERLGTALSRERFLLRGLGGLDGAYLERFAEVLEGILAAYDRVFGFGEWSKVPGKKLRVRIRLVDRITRPPHFAPQFPFHSEIDFPVVDAKVLSSPTRQGQFLFYGLCHELGHVIAMWGNRSKEEDHHAWAHYTGVTIVEELAKADPPPEWMKPLRDVRWRSLSKERERLKGTEPSLESADGVLATLLALHDAVGPRALGDAIDALDREDRRLRINRVRYYTFRELRGALREAVKEPAARKAVEGLLPR